MKEQAMTETHKAIEAGRNQEMILAIKMIMEKHGQNWTKEVHPCYHVAPNTIAELMVEFAEAGRSASDEAKDGRIRELEEALRETRLGLLNLHEAALNIESATTDEQKANADNLFTKRVSEAKNILNKHQ